jgi:hypothetical protein
MGNASGVVAGLQSVCDVVEFNAWNRTGATLAVGDFCLFDETGADTATTAATGGPTGNLLVPVTATIGVVAGDPGYRGCVVVDLLNKRDGVSTPGADDSLVRVRMRGFVRVKITAAENIVFGDMLGGVDVVHTLSEVTTTEGVRIYARAEEEIASAVAGTLYLVYFDGFGGLGNVIGT